MVTYTYDGVSHTDLLNEDRQKHRYRDSLLRCGAAGRIASWIDSVMSG